MAATLSTAAPVFNFTVSEFVISPLTVESLQHSTPEANYSDLLQEHGLGEAALPSVEPTGISRQVPATADTIMDIIAIAVVLVLWVATVITIGEYARDLYIQFKTFTLFELFRLLNVTP